MPVALLQQFDNLSSLFTPGNELGDSYEALDAVRGGRRRTLPGLTAASATPSAGRDPDRLDAYTAVVQAAEIPAIAEQGIDVSGQRPVANGIELDIVLDQAQADRLRDRGVDLKLTRVKGA